MNILIIRGYKSFEFVKETISISSKDVNVTMVPIGKPVKLKKKLLSIMLEYDFDSYDQIYVVSMASCITSLVPERHIGKVCMITPFFLYTHPVCTLLKSIPKDFFGCHILMAINGKMGRFDNRIRVKLAENDNVTDNKYFSKRFSRVEIIPNVTHCLGEDGVLAIVKDDVAKLLNK
jgi:hypothetical protein